MRAGRQIVIKTTRGRLAASRRGCSALHPYELPEFVVIDASAGEAYDRWVNGATA